MSIIRSPRPDSGYTVIRNEVLRDTRLSYRARGVLAAILSRPDSWETNAQTLAAEAGEGRDAVRTALSELEAAGYLERCLMRGADGHLSTHTVVYDTPRSPAPENPASVTENPSPEPGKPTPGKPTPENQAPYKETKKKEQTHTAPDAAEFEKFYRAYPRRVGKGQAVTAFKSALKKADADTLIAAASDFARNINGTDPKFVPHPSTWLNGERWLDEKPQPTINDGRPEGW